jgi:cysteine dioxygenase
MLSPMIAIEQFASGLAAIPANEFTRESVLDYLRRSPVSVGTMEPYLYFSPERYTRNLILKTPVFELIAICWESGQRSAIHNHCDQRCWMAMAYGKVQVHNFKLLRQNPETGFCELEPSTHFMIEAGKPQEVDPEEPIHQVINPASFNSRAVTLHVYSAPYDTCEVYDLKQQRYSLVQLVNTTEYGVVKSEIKLEKVALCNGAH